MRNLLIMVGAPGSGKSTWIKENGLEKYTVAPDNLRLLLSAPEYKIDGKIGIAGDNDGKVWKMLDEILENRMAHGDFTVVDATHTREKYMRRYKQLCDQYRYRLYVKRFDVPLETMLERNDAREAYKRVPDDIIRLHAERLKTLVIPNSITQIEKLSEINEYIRYEEINKPLYVIGDIHGTIAPLEKFLEEHYTEDAQFVFLGDYIDRGVNNAEVVNRLMQLSHAKNCVFLEGNHERWLWYWANGQEDRIRSREAVNRTIPALNAGGVDKKEARIFYRKLRSFYTALVFGKPIFVSHGGVTEPYPDFISAYQLINGVGDYEEVPEMYKTWHKSDGTYHGKDFTLVHGHRNIQNYSVKVDNNIYNLDGDVEHGGSLRVVKFSEDGTLCLEYPNENYVKPPEAPVMPEHTGIVAIDQLRASKFVNENVQGEISSFNFTRGAFSKGIWNRQTIKARGLFIDNQTNKVVARSYDKFFNFNELEITTEKELVKRLVFPVRVWQKYNGFLGIVGYDDATDQVLFTSKATIDGPFAKLNREVLESYGITEEKVRPYVEKGYSMIFEIIDPEKDPHIIKYENPCAYLLDVVKNGFLYEKMPDHEVDVIAHELGVPYKLIITEIFNFAELSQFIKDFTATTQSEGCVIEDENGFMFKLKGNYYRKWKMLRSLKDRVGNPNFRVSDFVFDEVSLKFMNWVKTLDPEVVKARDIISLREEFLTIWKQQ